MNSRYFIVVLALIPSVLRAAEPVSPAVPTLPAKGVDQSAPAVTPAPPPAITQKAIAERANQFGLSLYAQLRQKPGNLIASPFSLSSILTLTLAGASGATARQMADVLGLQDL